jgi:hypothetical protein
MSFHSKMVIFRVYVNLPEGKWWDNVYIVL